jgi:hypothetical protein
MDQPLDLVLATLPWDVADVARDLRSRMSDCGRSAEQQWERKQGEADEERRHAATPDVGESFHGDFTPAADEVLGPRPR